MILLDTNAIIALLYNPGFLSKTAHDTMIEHADELFVSVITPWEIIVKRAIGKIDIDDNASVILDDCASFGIRKLMLTERHLDVLSTLPMIHKDPFDRILISQAMAENMSIVTKDEIIPKYNLDVIW